MFGVEGLCRDINLEWWWPDAVMLGSFPAGWWLLCKRWSFWVTHDISMLKLSSPSQYRCDVSKNIIMSPPAMLGTRTGPPRVLFPRGTRYQYEEHGFIGSLRAYTLLHGADEEPNQDFVAPGSGIRNAGIAGPASGSAFGNPHGMLGGSTRVPNLGKRAKAWKFPLLGTHIAATAQGCRGPRGCGSLSLSLAAEGRVCVCGTIQPASQPASHNNKKR